jgi:hypothetical protein
MYTNLNNNKNILFIIYKFNVKNSIFNKNIFKKKIRSGSVYELKY